MISFGNYGVASGHIPGDQDADSAGMSVVVDMFGRIYVAGQILKDTVSDMALWRFNPDGSPDLGFGTNGYITGSTADVKGELYSLSSASGMTIDSSGIIYITGFVEKSGHYNMIIWKYDERAKINKLTIFAVFDAHEYNPAFGGDTIGKKIKIDSRGRIVVCGGIVIT